MALLVAAAAAACASEPKVADCAGFEGTCRSLDLNRQSLARTAAIHEGEPGLDCEPTVVCAPAPRSVGAEPGPAQRDVVVGLTLLFKRYPDLYRGVREALGRDFPTRGASPRATEPCAGMEATCQAIEMDRLALATTAIVSGLEDGKCGMLAACGGGPQPTGFPPRIGVIRGLVLLFNLYPDLYLSTTQSLGPNFPP